MKPFISFLFGVVIFLIGDITSAPCKLFPKIFGGSSGPTKFINFDVHYRRDMIVVGGSTMDQSLLPFPMSMTTAPIIILYSISNTTINWAVTDNSKDLY